jgi:hypothetical protein
VLDADFIASWDAYTPGRLTVIDFDDDDLPTLTYEMQSERDCFRVFYEWKSGDDEPEVIQSRVYLDRRPCRFGGNRTFFIAPCCSRRVLRLAVLSSGLMCGKCGGVTWKSRREQPSQRLVRKANKLSARLGCDSWTDRPTRPKYMRIARFESLKAERGLIVNEINRRIAVRLARKGLASVLLAMR